MKVPFGDGDREVGPALRVAVEFVDEPDDSERSIHLATLGDIGEYRIVDNRHDGEIRRKRMESEISHVMCVPLR